MEADDMDVPYEGLGFDDNVDFDDYLGVPPIAAHAEREFYVPVGVNDMLTTTTDTSASEAKRGKDIQAIPCDRMHTTRQDYRQKCLDQYKNYENIPFSGEEADKIC